MHIHSWDKWEIIEEGDIVSSISGKAIARYIIQKKICRKCGKTKLQKQRVD